MDVEMGAAVEGPDGHEIGSIDRFVVETGRREVQSVVVRKGALLPRDVAIPFSALTITEDGAVRVDYTSDDLDDLPEFDDALYTGQAVVDPPAPLESPPVGYEAPRMGQSVSYGTPPPPVAESGLPIPSQERAELAESLRRHHLRHAVIGGGTEVRTRDGDKIGDVERLAFGADGLLTRLVVKRGLLFGEEVTLPASAVASVDDQLIVLDMDASALKRNG